MRHAFEGTFPDHAGSFKMADDPTGYCKTPLDPDDLPRIFHDRALPLGCQTPADVQAAIEADGALSDVVVVGAARAGVGITMYEALLEAGATVFFVYAPGGPGLKADITTKPEDYFY